MADTKISALTAATTPLAGTEVLPVVQSGVTKKVSVNNLTAGKQVPVSSIYATSGVYIGASAPAYGESSNVVSSSNAPVYYLARSTSSGSSALSGFYVNAYGNSWGMRMGSAANNGNDLEFALDAVSGGVVKFKLSASTGDATIKSGNLVIGTSGKGIDFSTTSGTGTSELLSDYEEGTWTPTLASATGTLTTVGAATGYYTKVGRLVTLNANVVITTNGTGGTALLFGSLPFSISTTNTTGAGIEQAVTGKTLAVSSYNTTTLYVTFYDFTYPGANNARIVVSVSYYT